MHKRLLIAVVLSSLPALALAQATGVFTGVVVDSMQRPLPGAEVSLPTLSISRTTDDRGAFRIAEIPAGTQRVVIRKIGFGQLDTAIVFRDSQTVERRVTLGRVAILDSVVVEARHVDREMAGFEERRAHGTGRFLTRAQLAKMEGQTFGAVVQQLSGVALIRGAAGQSYIISKHGPSSRCPQPAPGRTPAEAARYQEITDECLRRERVFYVPETFEARQGIVRACYAIVYFNGQLMNPEHPTFPFDVNTFAPLQIEAVEWYESLGSVPMEYNARDARCGVLVLHSRRKD